MRAGWGVRRGEAAWSATDRADTAWYDVVSGGTVAVFSTNCLQCLTTRHRGVGIVALYRRRSLRRRFLSAILVMAVSAACSGEEASSVHPPDARATSSPGVERKPRPAGETHPLGLKFDLQRADSFEPYLSQVAGGATFHELVWCDVEATPGTLDWNLPDEAARLSDRLGYRLYLKIRVGSCWATGGRIGEERGRKKKTASGPPVDMAAYKRFVRAVVARYEPWGVHDYAVENEVNAPVFWEGSAADYEALVRTASEEIRSADPAARVFDAGLSSTAYGVSIASHLKERGRTDDAVLAYNRYYDRRFPVRSRDFPDVDDAADLSAALSLPNQRRHLDFFEATIALARQGLVDAYQLHFYERWDNVPALLELLRNRLPADMPIEAWEVGMFWPSGPADGLAQAEETAKLVSYLLGAGVGRIIYLPTAYDEQSRREEELRWGLLHPSGSPRPAGKVYADLAEAAAGDSLRKALSANGLHGIVFVRDNKSAILVWSDEGTVLQRRPVGGATVNDLLGGEVPWPDDGLRIDKAPVFIRVDVGLEPALQLLR